MESKLYSFHTWESVRHQVSLMLGHPKNTVTPLLGRNTTIKQDVYNCTLYATDLGTVTSPDALPSIFYIKRILETFLYRKLT